jgi:hypothetical protein
MIATHHVSRRRADVRCEVIRVDPCSRGAVVDVVTLEPCELGQWYVPAGTPLAARFVAGRRGLGPFHDAPEAWQAATSVVTLRARMTRRGVRYTLGPGASRLVRPWKGYELTRAGWSP